VLPWFTWIDVRAIDLRGIKPLQDRSGDELRAVVRAQVLRRALNADELGKHFDHAPRADATGHVDGQTLTRVLIDHRKTLELLAVRARIEHEVVGPNLTHTRR